MMTHRVGHRVRPDTGLGETRGYYAEGSREGLRWCCLNRGICGSEALPGGRGGGRSCKDFNGRGTLYISEHRRGRHHKGINRPG